MAGPLMTTAIALFGDKSWYNFTDNLSNELRPEEYSFQPKENRTIPWESFATLRRSTGLATTT
jgi:hypothetical protein